MMFRSATEPATCLLCGSQIDVGDVYREIKATGHDDNGRNVVIFRNQICVRCWSEATAAEITLGFKSPEIVNKIIIA